MQLGTSTYKNCSSESPLRPLHSSLKFITPHRNQQMNCTNLKQRAKSIANFISEHETFCYFLIYDFRSAIQKHFSFVFKITIDIIRAAEAVTYTILYICYSVNSCIRTFRD